MRTHTWSAELTTPPDQVRITPPAWAALLTTIICLIEPRAHRARAPSVTGSIVAPGITVMFTSDPTSTGPRARS